MYLPCLIHLFIELFHDFTMHKYWKVIVKKDLLIFTSIHLNSRRINFIMALKALQVLKALQA